MISDSELELHIIYDLTGNETGDHAEMHGRCVYITDSPGKLRKALRNHVPTVYLETPENGPCREAKYVWCGEDLPDERYLLRVWQRYYHLPWTIAETERLVIRESVMEDLPAFERFYREERDNPDVGQWTEEPAVQLRKYIDGQYTLCEYGLWTVVKKDTGEVVGRAGIEDLPGPEGGQELSFLIGRACRRRGYAREACEAVLSYMQEEFPDARIGWRTSGSNEASRHLYGILSCKYRLFGIKYKS